MLQSSLRLKLVEHFESIVYKVDIFTEEKIQKEEASEASQEFWNSRRDEQIRVIREIEQSCLDFVNRNPQIQDEDESIYVQNCCTFEHRGLLFLLKSKRRVQSDELSMLETRLKWPHLSYKTQMKHLIPNISPSYGEISVKFTHDIDSMLTRDSSVIDLEPWLNESKHLDELTYRPNLCPLEFLDEIGYIKEFVIYLYKDADKLQEWSKFVQHLVNKPSQIGKIILHLQVPYRTSDLNATLSLFPQHERFERKLKLYNRTEMDKSSLEKDAFDNIEPPVDQLTNWQVLRNVSLILQPEYVRMLNSSDLNLVDRLEINICYRRSDSEKVYSVSSKIFDSMPALKELKFIDFDPIATIKLTNQKRMFAGLKCLEKLSISNDILRSSFFINLPTLKHLSLEYNRHDSGTYWPGFKCPNLISLDILGATPSKSLSSGFSRFPKLEKLKLRFNSQGSLDQSVLNNLDKLTDLEISFDRTTMQANALSKLTSLRSVSFNFRSSYLTFKPKDHSLYDGLCRLERIMIDWPEYGCSSCGHCYEDPDTCPTEEYVFMKNLNRHVLFIDS